MLFRTEAARKSKSLGDVLLVRPLSFSILVGTLSAICLGLILFLCLFSYTKKIEVAGLLVPKQGLFRVVAPQSGVIAEQRVAEGELVKAGATLFVIRNRSTSRTSRDLEGTIVSLQGAQQNSYQLERSQVRKQALERKNILNAKISGLKSSISRIDDQIELQTRQTRLNEEILESFKKYQPENYVSKLDVQRTESALLEQQMRLSELKRSRDSAHQDLVAAQLDLQTNDIEMAREEQAIARQLSAVEQQLAESEARRELLVVAQRPGAATAVTVTEGQAVNAGQLLMAIVPKGSDLSAELYVPSRAIGFIQPGKQVQLSYQAFPYQTYGFATGWVSEVASAAVRPDEVSPLLRTVIPMSAPEPVYKVVVRIDKQTIRASGKDLPLRPGSVVSASVLLERRRLIMWMLDPLLSRTKKT